MTFCQILLTIQGYRRRTRESWEQSRILRHLIASALSSERIDIHDFQPFPGDKEDGEPAGLTEEEKRELLAAKEQSEKEQRHALIMWAREHNRKKEGKG